MTYRTIVAGLTALSSWWLLDESAGAVVNDSGPVAKSGAITGAIGYDVTDPLAGAGVESGSLAVGSGGLITVPNDPTYRLSLIPTNQWIVAADVQCNTTTGTPALISLGNPATTGYAISIDPVGKTVSYTCNGQTVTSGTIDLTSMKQLAVTWDGTNLAFWVNGVMVSTSTPNAVTVSDTSSALQIGQAVTVTPATGTPIEIDAGGAATGAWAADTAAAPSSFLTAGSAAEVAVWPTVVDLTDPSVPAGTPQTVMQSERYTAGPTLGYTIPVAAGQSIIHLYFSENYVPAQVVGGRVMTVTINGTVVDAALDVFALVGAYKAIVRTYTVTTPGSVQIQITATGNAPHVQGIYVVPPVGTAPGGGLGGLAAIQAGFGMYPGDQGLESSKVALFKAGGNGGPYVRQSLYKWVVDFTAYGPVGSPNGSLGDSTFGIFQSANAWQAFQTAPPPPGLPTPRMSLEVGLSTGTIGMSAAARSASLAATAAGTNDGPYTNLANVMVAAGYANACIRLGHENNAGDYPWGTLGFATADDNNFINAYRRVVGLMRAVAGANFIFDFCGLASVAFKTSQYPGDAWVDVIGADFYDVTRTDGITLAAYVARLAQWRDFCIAHGKMFSIPEWGCSATNGSTSGAGTAAGDNPDFINAVYTFCFNLPAAGGGKLAYHSYFQTDPPSEGLIALKNFPAARAVYAATFGQ